MNSKNYCLTLCFFMQLCSGSISLTIKDETSKEQRFNIHDSSQRLDIFIINVAKNYFNSSATLDNISLEWEGKDVFTTEDKVNFRQRMDDWMEKYNIPNNALLSIAFNAQQSKQSVFSLINASTKQSSLITLKDSTKPLVTFFETLKNYAEAPYYKMIINGTIIYPDYDTQKTIGDFEKEFNLAYDASKSLLQWNHINLVPITQEEFENSKKQAQETPIALAKGTLKLYDPLKNTVEIITISHQLQTIGNLKNNLEKSKSLPRSRFELIQKDMPKEILNNDNTNLTTLDNAKILFISLLPAAPGVEALVSEKPEQQTPYTKGTLVLVNLQDYKNRIGQIINDTNQEELEINFGRYKAIKKDDNILKLPAHNIVGAITLEAKTPQKHDLLIMHSTTCAHDLALLSMI